MANLTGRLKREYKTLSCMMGIYCTDHHEAQEDPLCPGCSELLNYAAVRLEKCPYGQGKPTCARCPVHCYKRAQRERVQEVMRYAGPRMTLRHPWLSLMHLTDKLRRVEHPMVARRKTSRNS